MKVKKRIIWSTTIIVLFVGIIVINVFFPFKVLYRQLFKKNDFHIEISEPVIVAQASEKDEQGWGYFQFPRMCYTENGNILIQIADKQDSISTYSGKYLYYITEDQGRTWRECKEGDSLADYTLKMKNGSYFQGPQLEDAYKTKELKGTRPRYLSDDGNLQLFDIEETASIPAAFMAAEYDPKAGRTISFESQYSWNGRERSVINNLLFPDGAWLYHFKMHSPHSIIREEDGSLFAAVYGYGSAGTDNNADWSKYNVHFLRSDDCGRTWRYVSGILSDDVCNEKSEGLCEPCLSVAPDGQYIVLMRSGSENPSYISYSSDKGASWSGTREFDVGGVDPQLLKLDCGVTLASYGRPGVYVRATDDPSCVSWKVANQIDLCGTDGESITADTCGYTSLIEIDKYTALLAYSDFNYPSESDPNEKSKTILVRKIHINYNY